MTARMDFDTVLVEGYVGWACSTEAHPACPGGWPTSSPAHPEGDPDQGTPCACSCHDEPAPGYAACLTGEGCSVWVGDENTPADVRSAAMAAHVAGAHS